MVGWGGGGVLITGREVLIYSFLVIKGLLVHLTDQRIRTLDLDEPVSRRQVTLEKIPTLNSGTRATQDLLERLETHQGQWLRDLRAQREGGGSLGEVNHEPSSVPF